MAFADFVAYLEARELTLLQHCTGKLARHERNHQNMFSDMKKEHHEERCDYSA